MPEINIEPEWICRICKNKTKMLLYATVRTENISGICNTCYNKMTPIEQSIISNLCGVERGINTVLKVLDDLQTMIMKETTISGKEVPCLVQNGISTLQTQLTVAKCFAKDRILDNL